MVTSFSPPFDNRLNCVKRAIDEERTLGERYALTCFLADEFLELRGCLMTAWGLRHSLHGGPVGFYRDMMRNNMTQHCLCYANMQILIAHDCTSILDRHLQHIGGRECCLLNDLQGSGS